MIDYIECYYSKNMNDNDSHEAFLAKKKAFSALLPVLMENELTQKQSLCLRYKYLLGKTQIEIAELLHLSQPTVSRYISSAKGILNNKLKYCWAAMSAALTEYDKLYS